MVFLMILEVAFIFIIYAYKKEVKLPNRYWMNENEYFYLGVNVLCVHSPKIMAHANTLFQKFISEYADDDDVRILVDTIQSDVSL